MRRILGVALLVGVMFFSAVATAQVSLTFDKQSVADGVWIGTVGGDVTGRLVTVLVAADQSQPVWDVDFYWIIVADDPSESFVARHAGTLDSVTGAVAMQGEVDEGFERGASVVEAGQLQDQATMRFAGTIELMPEAAEVDLSAYPWMYANNRGGAAAAVPAVVPVVSTCEDPYPMGAYPWDDLPDCPD